MLPDTTDAFAYNWQGMIQISCEGRSAGQLTAAVNLLEHGHAHGLFGASQLHFNNTGDERGQLLCEASNVNGATWLLLSNLLCAADPSAATIRLVHAQNQATIPVLPRWYAQPLPTPEMDCDLHDLKEVMHSFVLQFEFQRALNHIERENFCQALDSWAALVDAGAYPTQEQLALASAIGGYTGRFEHPATAGIYSEGIAASYTCFGHLIELANGWHHSVGIDKVTLEHHR